MSGTVGKAGKDSKNDCPVIRVKLRRQKVEILPLDAYDSFVQVGSYVRLSRAKMYHCLVLKQYPSFDSLPQIVSGWSQMDIYIFII